MRKSKKQLIAEGGALFREFTGHEPEIVDRVPLPHNPEVLIVIGKCDGIMYTTVRDGVTEKYVHQFKSKARPLFCVTPDGSQLVLLGGEYDFTERGIVDRVT